MRPLPTILHLNHHLPDHRFPLPDTALKFGLVSPPFMDCHHRLLPLILCPFIHPSVLLFCL